MAGESQWIVSGLQAYMGILIQAERIENKKSVYLDYDNITIRRST